MPPRRRMSLLLRGNSFRKEYEGPDTSGEDVEGLERAPTMCHGSVLLGPGDAVKRYTVVFDLDETLIYARDGPLFVRSHLESLLRAVHRHAEVIVWTAAQRSYAKAVVQEINVDGIIKHVIYRHKTWFRAADYTKDLHRLGRNLEDVLIVENTPDCVRANPRNGVIVQDFCVDRNTAEHFDESARRRLLRDGTLRNLTALVDALGESGRSVPDFLSSTPLVARQTVTASDGSALDVFFLPSRGGGGSPKGGERKVVRRNRDAIAAKAKKPRPKRIAARKEEGNKNLRRRSSKRETVARVSEVAVAATTVVSLQPPDGGGSD